jgi:hypothetical protein
MTVGAQVGVQTPPDANTSPKAQKLIAAFKAAYENKDVDALMSLVHWKDVTTQTRNGIRRSFEDILKAPIDNVFIVPVPKDQVLEYTHGSITYRINLKPVGWLRVFYKKNQQGVTTTSYMVGEKDGRYLIATAAPIP